MLEADPFSGYIGGVVRKESGFRASTVTLHTWQYPNGVSEATAT